MIKYMNDEIEELKKLNKKIRLLEKEIKKDFKLKEKEGYVISNSVKNTILSGIYYIKDKYSYGMIKDNLFTILFSIPDHEEKQNEIDEAIYKKLLDIFYNGITYTNKYESNMLVINCISNIKTITEWNRRELSCNCYRLLTEIRTSNIKKKIVCLKLLKNISNLHNDNLETRIINIIENTEDVNKLEVLDSLMEYIETPQASSITIYIDKFLDYIEYKKEDNYDKNLNKIIKSLYNLICNNNLITLQRLQEILSINFQSYNNKNMELIIKILNVNLYKIRPFNRVLLLIKILEMDYKSEEFENMLVYILNNIVFKIKDDEIQEKIIDRVCAVKYVKSLEVFTDLYPILDKYSDSYDVVNVLNDINKEDENNKVKKLVIPINYEVKED